VDVPRREGEYKGVRFVVETAHHPAGWTWELRILGQHILSQGAPWPAEELAITEAESAAEMRVDHRRANGRSYNSTQ
jgi:hypothetical protein